MKVWACLEWQKLSVEGVRVLSYMYVNSAETEL